MVQETIQASRSTKNILAAKLSIISALISLLALLALHFLSPEFAPSWHMVSEYANGKFEWVLFIFFSCWGISSWCAGYFLWFNTSSTAAKAGVILLFVSGLGEILAAFLM
jgi:hypothetical protein